MRKRYIILLLKVMVYSKECAGTVRYRAKECKKRKGNLHGGRTSESKGGNIGKGGSNKRCNFCGVNGLKGSQFFKKNAKNAPKWWKEKNVKVEQPHQV
jgi:hypothetical protein